MRRIHSASSRFALWTLAAVAILSIAATMPQPRVAVAQPNDVTEAGDQGETTDAEPQADDAGGEASLGQIIMDSGWSGVVFYVALLIFSVVALTVALERLVHLRRSRFLPTQFTTQLKELVARQEDNAENFRKLSDQATAPVAKVLWAGVMRAGRPLPEVEKAMEDAAARELAATRSRNRPLSVIGQIAPLVGLLGTVVGMIIAFRISSQAGLGKAEMLAKGIYIALMTTAAGLTIAIPCLLSVAWFNTLVDRFFREIDECLLETMPSFTRMEESTHMRITAARQHDDEATPASTNT